MRALREGAEVIFLSRRRSRITFPRPRFLEASQFEIHLSTLCQHAAVENVCPEGVTDGHRNFADRDMGSSSIAVVRGLTQESGGFRVHFGPASMIETIDAVGIMRSEVNPDATRSSPNSVSIRSRALPNMACRRRSKSDPPDSSDLTHADTGI